MSRAPATENRVLLPPQSGPRPQEAHTRPCHHSPWMTLPAFLLLLPLPRLCWPSLA